MTRSLDYELSGGKIQEVDSYTNKHRCGSIFNYS